MTSNDIMIVKAMRTYGGSFVQKLAETFVAADEENRERMKDAFPEYFMRYLKLSLDMEETE